MRIRAIWVSFLLPAIALAPLGRSVEAAPWQNLALFKRVEADPKKSYALDERNGPWMILAVTFIGADAERDADELVYELRKRYKLPAYKHKARFDYTGTVQGRGVDRSGAPKTMRYRRDREYDEVAVLVGDYASVDDPEAQKTLRKIKYARPECLMREQGKVNRPLAALREVQRQIHKNLAELRPKNDRNDPNSRGSKKDRGPLGHSFLTTNPRLPREYFVPEGLDPFVVELNKNIEYSLLECPRKYSVRVATFTGKVVIKPNEIRDIEEGGRLDGGLEEAAHKAHKLAESLRRKGWEAYEFHDRHSSIVAVGSFDSVGTRRADGTIDWHPAMRKIMNTFGAGQSAAGGAMAGTVQLKDLGGIPFDAQPAPVEVPQQPIGASYGRNLFGMR